MVKCPACRQTEPEGELFCSICGTRLWRVPGESSPTLAFINTGRLRDGAPISMATGPATDELRTGQVALMLTSTVIILEGKTEYVLGREGVDNENPDVNLSALGGRERGVSRKHAILRVDRRQLLLMDLGSSNGTWLNGTQLTANEPMRLESGDEIRLGKLPMKVRFNL